VTYILANQLIAAKLNILSGANPDSAKRAVEKADGWLIDNPLGSKPGGASRLIGIALAEILENYNLGVIGPGQCEDFDDPDDQNPPTSTKCVDSITY